MIDTDSPFQYRVVGPEDFDSVQTLWEKLRAHHAQLSWHFAGEMHRFTFEPRKQEILAKGSAGKLRIELVSPALKAQDIAYCISTITAEGCGEVDSIFVEEEFRGYGIGSELLRRALNWFDEIKVSSKIVTVAHGNEGALALYKRFGYHPRTILLQHSDTSSSQPD